MDKAHAASEKLAEAKGSYEAYEKAYRAVEGTAAKPKRKRSPRTASGASEDTKTLFSALFEAFGHKDFGYPDIEKHALANSVQVNMINVRSNASDYVRHGYLDRPVNGRFIITEKGKGFFGVQDKKDSPPPTMPGAELPGISPKESHESWGKPVDIRHRERQKNPNEGWN